jgi:DNA invertase Pin-like site-specific DNA recombinase
VSTTAPYGLTTDGLVNGPLLDAIIRVSQRGGRSGDAFMSPDEQVAAVDSMAARTGARIRRYVDETDSVSGGSVEREGLQGSIDDAVRGEIDGILVAKVDRFARTVQGGLSAIVRLEDGGKLLWSAREGVIVGDEKATATDKMMRTFWLMLAQWQRDTLTEGWEAVRRRHIANGVANHAPFGYRKDVILDPQGKRIGGTRQLVPDPEEAPWVPVIFEHRANRWSWAKICDWLAAEDVKTRNGNDRWSIESVRNIIVNRAYLGEIRSGDVVNTKAHDALVSVDLWERANVVTTTTGARNEAEPYMLTTVIRCASCGVRMFGLTDRRKNAKGEEVVNRFYRCRGRHGSWGKCPAPARVRADEIEALVNAEFRAAYLGSKVAVPSEATDEVAAAEAELSAAEAELRAFVRTTAALDEDLFAEGVADRTARRDAAREHVAQARSSALGVALPANLAETWDSLTVGQRQPFIAAGFAVVAVARRPGPAAERSRTWLTGDPTTPTLLPGVDGHAELVAIEV